MYGRESSVTAAAVSLVQSGKFSYKYKTVSSGATVSTPSVNVGGGNSGGANSGGNASFTGNGNVDWGVIYRSEADAATKGIVDTYMKDYNGDKARVERVLRKNFSDEPKALQIYLNYLNSL